MVSLVVSVIQPIWKMDVENSPLVLTAFYFLSGSTYTYFPYVLTAILAVASITLAAIEIRKFNDRLLQLKLGALNSLFMAGMVISAVYFASQLTEKHEGGQFGLGLYLPALAVICNFLANRFIRRDERSVRDSDRLR